VESDPEDRTVLQTGDPALLYGVTWAMSAASIALGSAVLLGWATGSQRLVQLASGCPSMKPAAATCFILLGTALAGRVTPPWPARADLIAATAAGAVVVLALLEYATGRDVGVDHFPFTARVAGGGQSGRVALATGLEILLLVMAVAAHAMGRRRITQALCLLSLTGSLVAILGFVYGARHLYSINAGSAMALNTAIGLAGVPSAC
jgi:hypothetical protein